MKYKCYGKITYSYFHHKCNLLKEMHLDEYKPVKSNSQFIT